MSDEQLIKSCLEGNQNAFRELIKKYESRVAATVIGMLGKCPEADDVGQETFLRFYRSLSKFRGDSSVATYLTRIAINLSLNELKRRQRRAKLFFRQPENGKFDIVDESDDRAYSDEKEVVQKAIQELAPNYRSIIVLRLLDGYSTEEAAAILGIPLGTALSRLSRAQKKLKEILSPYLGEMV